MDEQAAAARLRALNGGWLTEAEAARLAPQLVELLDGLAIIERRLAPEAEPATVQQVGDRTRDD